MLKFTKIHLSVMVIGLMFIGAVSKAEVIHIFAASSLKTALDKALEKYPVRTTIIRISYAASSTLAKQIEQGAPADIFMSADQDWMNYLEDRKFIKSGSRFDFVGNRLVLIAPQSASFNTVNLTLEDLKSALGNGRLATGAVNTVPVGKYAKQALETLGFWSSIKTHIVGADSSRSTLNFVALGEAQLGIVYESDAKAEPKVKVVANFPQSSHALISYPVALVQNSKPEAVQFIEYLKSPQAFSFFTESSFVFVENVK